MPRHKMYIGFKDGGSIVYTIPANVNWKYYFDKHKDHAGVLQRRHSQYR